MDSVFSLQMKEIRHVHRVFVGTAAQTPTAALPSIVDIGLLPYCGEKLAALQEFVDNVPASVPPVLPMTSAVNLIGTSASELLNEADNVDAALTAARRVEADVDLEWQNAALEHQLDKRRNGTAVEQVLSLHYGNLDPKSKSFAVDSLYVEPEMRRKRQQVKAIVGVLKKIQRLLHGGGRRLPSTERRAAIDDIGVQSAFSKARNRVKDAALEIPRGYDIPELKSLVDLFNRVEVLSGQIIQELEAEFVEVQRHAGRSISTSRVQSQIRSDSAKATPAPQITAISHSTPRSVPQPVRNPTATVPAANDKFFGTQSGGEKDELLAYYCT